VPAEDNYVPAVAIVPSEAAVTIRPSRLRRTAVRARRLLPSGRLWRREDWEIRHRGLSALALLAVVAVAAAAGIAGRPVAAVVIAASGWLVGGAYVDTFGARSRTLLVTLSLLVSSDALPVIARGSSLAWLAPVVAAAVIGVYQSLTALLVTVLAAVAVATWELLEPPVFGGHSTLAAAGHGSIFVAAVLAVSVTQVVAWKLAERQELLDPLTGLPNRTSFMATVRSRLSRTDRTVAVLFIDLDNFKEINDTGGHHAGDQALLHAAGKMADAVRVTDVVARLGGDEFAILVDGSAEDAAQVGERLAESLRSPMVVDGREIFISASIGAVDAMAVASRDATDLIRAADLAMYLAKSGGKGRVVTYSAEVDDIVQDRSVLAADLQLALERREFEVVYQPLFRGDGEIMSGVEALLRWNHPKRGTLTAEQFIRLAETTGEIKRIGPWVLRTATAQVAQWQRTMRGCRDLELAVNLSTAQLRDPQLVGYVTSALNHSGLPAGCVLFEVTESTLLSDLDLAHRQLDAVRTLGARVAIDDFGTGFSSLSYLARLPADQVKIDRSFVVDLVPGSPAIAVVGTIVRLARELGLDVFAEGVELTTQQEILSQLGCTSSQGFLYSSPLAAGAFEVFADGLGATADVLTLRPERTENAS
jgi:diguanylate cyclase (GGDEF)-like protein